MKDILLVNPKEDRPIFMGGPPLGLLWIANYLEKNDYNVGVVDLEVEEVDLKQIIEEAAPQIIGIGGTSSTRFESFEIARIAKSVDTSITTVYGGCHATFTAEDTLSHIKDIDVIVRGEGEYTVLDLARAIIDEDADLKNILGISYRDDGNIVHNPPRPRISDLDALGLPARHLVNMQRYVQTLYILNLPAGTIMTSRGCPFNCSYCSASAMFGRIYTTRSAKCVVDEVELLIEKYGVKGIRFFDSTFTLNRKHVLSICDELTKRGFKIPWNCEIRVDTVDKDLLKKMQEAGCYFMDIGVESANEKVLKLMNKQITLEQAENVINWADELGLITNVAFTFGHIGETFEDCLETKKFIKKWRDKITNVAEGIGILIYPGTPVESFAKSNGLLPPNFSWSEPYENIDKDGLLSRSPNIPILIQPQLGYSELKKLRYMDFKENLFKPRRIWNSLKRRHSLTDMKRRYKTLVGVIRDRMRQRSSSRQQY